MWVWETNETPQGAIVIVHGSGEHHGRYRWLRRQWLDSGFHVIMGDLPGHGKSPGIKGHIDRFDEYIDAVESWTKKGEKFHLPLFLLGHSLGGLSVIRTLQEKQMAVQGIILSSPCLGLTFPMPSLLKKTSYFLNKVAPELLIPTKRSAGNKKATRNQEVLQRDAGDPLMLTKISARWYWELETAMEEAFQKIDKFPDVPVLILQAGDDKIVNKHSVKKWFDSLKAKNKVYKEWTGLYHEVFNEPERKSVFQHALSFIENNMSSGGLFSENT
ncbi:lysophospholipase [Scopulibacillus daqui]|uniref:Lysophospholipase n=1 Tax=Scopulibacillus daqui TaxID=1469162 RepID=A0ABS2Q3J4_9BACL|nr:lysophospholipase [Scopulibacillus daqui]